MLLFRSHINSENWDLGFKLQKIIMFISVSNNANVQMDSQLNAFGIQMLTVYDLINGIGWLTIKITSFNYAGLVVKYHTNYGL